MDSQLFSLAKTYFILSNVLTALILFSFIVYAIVLFARMIRQNRRRANNDYCIALLIQIREGVARTYNHDDNIVELLDELEQHLL